MNISLIRVVVAKELREILKNKRATTPMIILPALFVVVLPVVFYFASGSAPFSAQGMMNIEKFLKVFPAHLFPAGLDTRHQMLYAMLLYYFTPFFLIIPIMVASILASMSFAGEKENRTIEGLLYTPLTDRELIFAKIAVAFIPAVGVTWGCFIVYACEINGFFYGSLHRICFPNATWALLMLWTVPSVSFLSLALIVAVSERAAGVWEAQQISGLLVVPVVGLVISQAAGVILMGPMIAFISGLVFLTADLLAFRWIVRRFRREDIVTKFL